MPAGADAYVTKYIIHDWDDEEAWRLLQNCRESDGRRRAVCSSLIMSLPPGNRFDWGKLMDINMMVIMGSKERTKDEFRAVVSRPGCG